LGGFFIARYGDSKMQMFVTEAGVGISASAIGALS
jgi:hypothetical protein